MMMKFSLSLAQRITAIMLLALSWSVFASGIRVEQQDRLFPEPHGASFSRQHTELIRYHHRDHRDHWHNRRWWRAHHRDYWYRHHWVHRHWNDPYWRHRWPWWYRHHYWNDFTGVAITVPLAYEAGRWLSNQADSNPQPVIEQQQSVTTGMNYATGISTLPANARTVLQDGKTYYQWQGKTYRYDWKQYAYVEIANFNNKKSDNDKTEAQ